MTLKVGLLGAGRIGAIHANTISSHPESTLVAVSDFVEESAQTLAKKYDAEVRSSDEIIAAQDIDAILIASPTNTHSDMIEAGIASGKAVLCEKPVDLDLSRARKCLAATKDKADSVMIGFNRRFDTSFSALQAAAAAGEVGKLELLSITSFDPEPPPLSYVEVSGGLFRDMMIHDFDIANFVMGELPESVTAHGTSIIDPAIGAAGDVDTAVVTLNYADGKIAVIKNSRRAIFGYDQRVELLGSEGLLQVQNLTENTLVKSNSKGITSAKPMSFFLERYMPAYVAEWAAFVDSVANNKAAPVSLRDGVLALQMAEAATQSCQSGERVKLSDLD